jgi:two-component system nitrate/nitrite response regulator NarL
MTSTSPTAGLPATSLRSPAPIAVLAADKQPLYREALARTVRQRPALRLVGEVGDGHAALEAIVHAKPDVAVLDVRLPGLDGPQVLNAVVRDGLATRVLLLAAAVQPSEAYGAIAAGAAGYLSKLTDAEGLYAAITAVADGSTVLAPDAQTEIAREIRRRACDDQPVLNDRERQILVLVADGHSADAIGRRLHLSSGTVKATLLKVYHRLEVSERAAAVAVALRRGLID